MDLDFDFNTIFLVLSDDVNKSDEGFAIESKYHEHPVVIVNHILIS